jgi:hypothetical protein
VTKRKSPNLSAPQRYPHGEREDGTFIKAYPYADEHNELVMKVERWEGIDDNGLRWKKFPTYMVIEPVPAPWETVFQLTGKNLPWIKGWPHQSLIPLYRLPQLIAAPLNQPVFFCEGEEDTDNVRAKDGTATSCAGGVDNFLMRFCFRFEGLEVIIPIDNDGPGRIYGELRRRVLSRVAKSVTVALLPSLPDKGDDQTGSRLTLNGS